MLLFSRIHHGFPACCQFSWLSRNVLDFAKKITDNNYRCVWVFMIFWIFLIVCITFTHVYMTLHFVYNLKRKSEIQWNGLELVVFFGIVMICFWRMWTSTYYCQHFSEDSNIIVYFLKFSKCVLSSLDFPEVLRMFKNITDALELSRFLTASVESSGIFRMRETMRTK